MRTNGEFAIQSKRKNRRIILIISLLLLMVAMTSVFLGTLSKYITSGDSSDEADVAKFGFSIPTSIELFANKYDNVESENGENIIAPGTTGSYTFNVSGTSEVAYEVKADIDVEYSIGWSEYTPLEFSIDNQNWTNFEQFETNLATALETNVMAPNTAYSSTNTIYWRWPFHISEDFDRKDTAVGRLASEGNAPTVTVNMTVTAVQVD